MTDTNNITKSLSQLTGKNYKDLICKAGSCMSSDGSLDVKAFTKVARSAGASDFAIAGEVSQLTGMGIQAALYKINMPMVGRVDSIGRLDSGLRMPGLPSWHPMNKK